MARYRPDDQHAFWYSGRGWNDAAEIWVWPEDWEAVCYSSRVQAPMVADRFRMPFNGSYINSQEWGALNTEIIPGQRNRHLGDDHALPRGTSVLAVANGAIIAVGDEGTRGFGKYVIIRHVLPDGSDVYSLYAHLSDTSMTPRGDITVGTVIGKSGNTGQAEGFHLHWEISQENGFLDRTNRPWLAGGYAKDGAEFARADDITTDPSDFVQDHSSGGGGSSDLIVSDASLDAVSYASGGEVNAFWSVRNIGGGAAATSTVGIFLSTDRLLGAGDRRLDTNATSALNAGSTDPNESDAFILPSSLAAGTYNIGIAADYTGVISETNEGNNVAWFTITVGGSGARADLVIVNARILDTSLSPGEELEVYWDVKNVGSGAAAASEVGLYLSSDANITGSDLRLDTNSTSALAPNGSDTGEYDAFDLPSNIAPGTYYIGILADHSGSVAEINEGNNAQAFRITVSGGGAPDLIVTHASINDDRFGPGDEIELEWDVSNVGSGIAGESEVGIYLSTDLAINSQTDLRLETNSTSPVSAGGSDTNEYERFDLPSGIVPGRYYIAIFADHRGQVAESNDSNNGVAFEVWIDGNGQATPVNSDSAMWRPYNWDVEAGYSGLPLV